MSERRPSFRERDIRRAVRALEAEGKSVVRVEIEGGKLVIVTSPGEPVRGVSEWRKRIEALS
jgi:hypothetical protein